MSKIFGPLQERFGESLGKAFNLPLWLIALLLGVVITLGTWNVFFVPLGRAACTQANEKIFQGEWNSCTLGGYLQSGLSTVGRGLSAALGDEGGTGGPTAPQPVEVEPVSPHQSNASADDRDDEVLEDTIVAQEVLSSPVDVAVLGEEVWIYSEPFESIGNALPSPWDVVNNPEVRVYATLLTANNQKWVRITELNHDQSLYLLWEEVETGGLPTPVEPAPPLEELAPGPEYQLPEGTGPLVDSGEYEGQYALDAWQTIRNQGSYTLNDDVVAVLAPLADLTPAWGDLHQQVADAVDTRSWVDTVTTADDQTAALRQALTALEATDVTWEITEIESAGLWDDGSHLVTIQPRVDIDGVTHDVGDSFTVPIRVLRQTVETINEGAVLTLKGGA